MKKLISFGVLSLLVAVGATAGEKGTPAEAKALLDKAVTLVQTQGDTKALSDELDKIASLYAQVIGKQPPPQAPAAGTR